MGSIILQLPVLARPRRSSRWADSKHGNPRLRLVRDAARRRCRDHPGLSHKQSGAEFSLCGSVQVAVRDRITSLDQSRSGRWASLTGRKSGGVVHIRQRLLFTATPSRGSDSEPVERFLWQLPVRAWCDREISRFAFGVPPCGVNIVRDGTLKCLLSRASCSISCLPGKVGCAPRPGGQR